MNFFFFRKETLSYSCLGLIFWLIRWKTKKHITPPLNPLPQIFFSRDMGINFHHILFLIHILILPIHLHSETTSLLILHYIPHLFLRTLLRLFLPSLFHLLFLHLFHLLFHPLLHPLLVSILHPLLSLLHSFLDHLLQLHLCLNSFFLSHPTPPTTQSRCPFHHLPNLNHIKQYQMYLTQLQFK
jgi:hypothetical protein